MSDDKKKKRNLNREDCRDILAWCNDAMGELKQIDGHPQQVAFVNTALAEIARLANRIQNRRAGHL